MGIFRFMGQDAMVHRRSNSSVYAGRPRSSHFSFLLLFLLLALPLCQFDNSYAQAPTIDSMLWVYARQNKDEQITTTKSFYAVLDAYDRKIAKKATHRLLDYSRDKNPWVFVRSLIYDANNSELQEGIQQLNAAVTLGDREKFPELVAMAEEVRAILYKDFGVYDSAMTSILRARDLYTTLGDAFELISIKHTIADLFYEAGNIDRAEKIYLEIVEKKGDPVAWDLWRKVVITNDLALIATGRRNFRKAASLFRESERYICSKNNGKLNATDSTQLEYVYDHLIETLTNLNDFKGAEECYEKAAGILRHFNNESGFLSLYIYKGQLCFQMKQLDSARIYLEQAQAVANKYHSTELEAVLYLALSDLYAEQGKFREAYIAHRTYEQLNDSLIAQRYEAGTMDILAEKNYEHYNTKIVNYSREVKALVFGLTIFALLLGLILALYFKLSYSHQQLVRKSIALDGATPAPLNPQLDSSASDESTPTSEARQEHSGTPADIQQEETEAADLDSSTTADLIRQLTAFLEKERGFMNADLTLQDVADHLGTNRTYVSRAVNAVFKTNFSTYLNELRIKEAIRLISLGEHKALSIEGLASAVGFNNRKSFGSAFQKYTGVSPSNFIKNYDRLI